VRLDYFKL